MRRWVFVIGAFLALGLGLNIATGQPASESEPQPYAALGVHDDPSVKRKVVRKGEYRNLNFWRKLKLGTAPYVNAGLLKRVKVAYTYPMGDLIETAGLPSVSAKLQTGEIGIVQITAKGSFIVISPDDPNWTIVIEAFIRHKFKGLLILSNTDNLFGKTAADAVVSWDATDPVVGKAK